MISKHSAHSTSLPIGFHTWLWRYTCLLLLISMLWHRQAIFKSKGDKLSTSAECRIRTQGLRHLIASRLNACWQTDWAIEDQAKNLNSTARPYDQQAFSPLDLTASWLSHVAQAMYMFVVVNFDALAQASDNRIERRQVVRHTYIHICWFNFDALAQGNAYKPTKEPINYRGPGGDRIHDLQTEATPPAASCPARTLHATEIAPKNATPMTCPWLHWTTENPSGMHRCQFQHLCVLILNCALALAIYIFVGLILMLWHRETHINPQRNR